MAEKLTDNNFLNLFRKLAKIYYNVESRPDLFGTLKPDGWFENTSDELLIIENKSFLDLFGNARSQLLKYKNIVLQLSNKYKRIYLLFGYNNGLLFDYKIYNSNMKLTNLRLEDLNLKSKKLPGLNALDTETTWTIIRTINHSKHKNAMISNILRILNIDVVDKSVDNDEIEESNSDYTFEESTTEYLSDNESNDDVIYLGRKETSKIKHSRKTPDIEYKHSRTKRKRLTIQ
jgi:hypothetical protein